MKVPESGDMVYVKHLPYVSNPVEGKQIVDYSHMSFAWPWPKEELFSLAYVQYSFSGGNNETVCKVIFLEELPGPRWRRVDYIPVKRIKKVIKGDNNEERH